MAFKIKRFISPLSKIKNPEKPKAAKDVKGFDEQFEIVKAKYPILYIYTPQVILKTLKIQKKNTVK